MPLRAASADGWHFLFGRGKSHRAQAKTAGDGWSPEMWVEFWGFDARAKNITWLAGYSDRCTDNIV
jgi:hypothetical protein